MIQVQILYLCHRCPLARWELFSSTRFSAPTTSSTSMSQLPYFVMVSRCIVYLITTPADFHDRALQLGDRLVKDRKKCSLESKQYHKALRSVLKDLYELVCRPVIEEFRKMKIEEQSRVWWCPTSVFCHLPLHAMGPIPCDDGVKRYFSDLYISSYTPTLSALIESRKSAGGLGGQTSSKPSILCCATRISAIRDPRDLDNTAS